MGSKKSILQKNSKIIQNFNIDCINSRILTADYFIYLTRSGAYEFVKFVDIFIENFSKRYLRKNITQKDIRHKLDEIYNIDVPDEFRDEWTNVFFYYFRDEIKLKGFIIEKSQKDLNEQRSFMKSENKEIYKTIIDLQNAMKNWSPLDFIPQ